MVNGLKTSKDGTLQTTLGKKLVKSVKFKAADIKAKPVSLQGGYKEITFALVPDNISLFIDIVDEDHRLTIEDKCSIEALAASSFVQVAEEVDDDKVFEIWLWN